MRFFKRREEPDIEVRRTRSHGLDPRTNEVAMTTGNKNRAMMNQRPSLSANHMYNKKSIGDLAKKLNCASAKVKDDEAIAAGEQSILVGIGKDVKIPGMMKRSSSWGGALRRSNNQPHHFDPNITRPVLITIKDGELPGQHSQKSSPARSRHSATMADLERSYLSGGGRSPKSSPSRPSPDMSSPQKPSRFKKFGVSARKSFSENKTANAFQRQPPSPSRAVDLMDASGARLNLTITTNDSTGLPHRPNQEALPPYRTAKEIARRNRWKRGLEMQRESKSPSPQEGKYTDSGEDDSIFEDTTHFTHSTGHSSYLTGDFGSVGSYSTDYTETDESGDASSRYHRKRNKGRGTLKSPPRYDPSGKSVGGPCSSRQQIMSGIAEDFGIVVMMLWSDGSACIGTAADITKETVSGCKDER